MEDSSSSSSSDSDDEPVRKIRINIRPRASNNNGRSVGANNQDLKASVESWRPLGPLPHPTLSRRQSSLSSISTGGGLHSSPSCSSLVNDFGNRAFTNFMPPSRTSSPIAINHGDTIPIAVAIQESISLNIEGAVRHQSNDDDDANDKEFNTTNTDSNAQMVSSVLTPAHRNDGIVGDDSLSSPFEPKFTTRSMGNLKLAFSNALAKGTYGRPSTPLRFRLSPTENIVKFYASRLIRDLNTNQATTKNTTCDNNVWPKAPQSDLFLAKSENSLDKEHQKVFELDTDLLMAMLKKMSDQQPSSRYYNVDVLRYQLSPMSSLERCPLQVCAYWKIESKLIKIRIDFKISADSGIHMDKLRDISFSVNLSTTSGGTCPIPNNNNVTTVTSTTTRAPPTTGGSSMSFFVDNNNAYNHHNHAIPIVSSQPKAHWNSSIKQLKWKFDLLDAYQGTGLGSLFAKIDYGATGGVPDSKDTTNGGGDTIFQHAHVPTPSPVDVKFFIVDSTLSKVGFNIVSPNYKMTLLKREIRSSGYTCEPFVILG